MTEAEAVAALRAGQPVGLEFLMSLYELSALRVAVAITADRTLAEDVVAEAFIKVHQRIGRYDSNRAFGPWLHGIVTKEALNAARKARNYEKLTSLLGRQPRTMPGPEEIVEQNELHRLMTKAVRSLPPNERAVISLRYLVGMDEKAVANSLGWPLGTVKTRLHRCRSELQCSCEY
jgi:RNA polymerase sigma-70 factor (ECF subfamily)